MRASEYALLVLLAALWGLSYVFYRIGAPVMGPAVFVELRLAIAGALLLAYVVLLGRGRQIFARLRPRWRDLLVLGTLNAALPFTLIAIGELVLPASYSSILNATTPLFATLLAAPFLGQAITVPRVLGIFLGVTGVAVLVGTAEFALTAVAVTSIVLTIGAALSYGASGIFLKLRFDHTDPVELSIGQQIAATAVLLPFAVATAGAARISVPAVGAVLGIALAGTVLAYLIYFRIVQTAGPIAAASVTMLMPIFGVAWAFALLREPIGPGTVAGIAIILVGVALLTDLRFTPRRAPTPPG
jgi:drug/metabolite transporter (DMT)-like permease